MGSTLATNNGSDLRRRHPVQDAWRIDFSPTPPARRAHARTATRASSKQKANPDGFMLQAVEMSASVDSARARHADRRYGRMTVLPDEPAEPFVRRLASRFGWLRRNALLMLALVAVIGSLIATVAVVRNGATAKDRLRQAQIALVQVPAALFATVQSPQALLSGEPAAPSEFPLSESLRDRLATLTVTVARFWSTPLTHTIRREARQVKSSTAQLMSMIADHRLRRANQIFDRRINPRDRPGQGRQHRGPIADARDSQR
jgi:hypothetical protein